jgi:hypothetical protein
MFMPSGASHSSAGSSYIDVVGVTSDDSQGTLLCATPPNLSGDVSRNSSGVVTFKRRFSQRVARKNPIFEESPV